MKSKRNICKKGTALCMSALLLTFAAPFFQATNVWQARASVNESINATQEDASEEHKSEDTSLEELLAKDAESLQQLVQECSAASFVYAQTSTFCCTLNAPIPYTFVAAAENSSALQVSSSYSANTFELILMPVEMFDEPQTVRIAATGAFEDAEPFVCTVQPPSKKAIEITVPALPFRLQHEQTAAVYTAINNQAEAFGVRREDIQNEDGSYQELVSLALTVTYPASFNSLGFSATASFALNPSLQDKYELFSDTCVFSVQPIQSVQQPATFRFLNGATAQNWVNSDVVAVYEGHALAADYAGTYMPQFMMNNAEGSYSNQSLYAKNNASGVITKVIGLAYNLDKTAPQISSFSVEGAHTSKEDTWFFWDKAHVKVAVSDAAGCMISPSASTVPRVSGLVMHGAHITYMDASSGNLVSKANMRISADGTTGMFEFDIDKDQDTEVASYQAFVRDAAGNQLDSMVQGAQEIPADVMRLVADSSNPRLAVTYDTNELYNERYSNNARTATITIDEPNFHYLQKYDPNQVIVSITEGAQSYTFTSSQFRRVEGNTWSVSYQFFNDGAYSISAQVKDLVGKASESYFDSFIIDSTSPVMSVVFDNGQEVLSGYYDAERTATVTVVESNFSPLVVDVVPTTLPGNGTISSLPQVSNWVSVDNTHTCTVTFSEDGVYGLTVSGTDLAHNALPTYTCSAFTIDTETPNIAITVNGDPDAGKGAYRHDAAVQVTLSDTNINPSSQVSVTPVGLSVTNNPFQGTSTLSSTELYVAYPSPQKLPANDNVYRIEVIAEDLAGNTTTKIVDFSVNRFGSTYQVSEDTQAMLNKRCMQSSAVSDIRITEINPSGLNEDNIAVSLTANLRNATLQKDKHYTVSQFTNANFHAYEYVISKDNFTSDGTYYLTLQSDDVAGNASMNIRRNQGAELEFIVDNTAPLITLTGCSNPSRFATSQEVIVSVSDDSQVAQAAVYVNNNQVALLEGKDIQHIARYQFTLQEAAYDQTVRVEAYDVAGNKAEQQSPKLFINSKPLTQWLHAWLPIVGIAALGIAAIRFVAAVHRRGKTINMHDADIRSVQ